MEEAFIVDYHALGKIERLSDFLKLLEENFPSGDTLWFRGQKMADWGLTPSIFRPYLGFDTKDKALQAEGRSLTIFKQRSIPYIDSHFMDYTSISDWHYLFLMQHYGIPTRLLDWTENALTALYFAVSEAKRNNQYDKDSAVWILKPKEWNKMIFGQGSSVGDVLTPSDSELKNWERDARNLSNGPVAIYGDYNSKRITSQQGTFTMFGGSERDMARSQAEAPISEQILSKILISGESHLKIFRDLRQFGFTDTHLYPDMNGISKDITNMIGGEK